MKNEFFPVLNFKRVPITDNGQNIYNSKRIKFVVQVCDAFGNLVPKLGGTLETEVVDQVDQGFLVLEEEQILQEKVLEGSSVTLP